MAQLNDGKKHIFSYRVCFCVPYFVLFQDPSYYKSLEFLLNNPVETFGTELTFSVEVEEFGVCKMRELKEGGASIPVTDENKEEYVQLVCQMKMKGRCFKKASVYGIVVD